MVGPAEKRWLQSSHWGVAMLGADLLLLPRNKIASMVLFFVVTVIVSVFSVPDDVVWPLYVCWTLYQYRIGL